MKRILIVEDEAITALHLKQELIGLGYEIAGVTDTAAGAVKAAMELKPDLVLMDIHLAGHGDGVSAAAVIHPAADVPVVFLTAHADDATVRRALETAPFGYVLKPLQVRELRVSLELAFYKHAKETEMRQLVKSLEVALGQVRQLSGLLPICATCKRIRDDQGAWHILEAYLMDHSQAAFSHTICPECDATARQQLDQM